MRRAFTLIELCYVLAIIGLLTAVTVPTYDVLLRRARAQEAPTNMQAIAHAEMQHFRDHGHYLACPATGELGRGPAAFPDAPCWRQLGVRFTEEVRYRYGVELDGDSFVVTAEGDLDTDGVLARYRLDGRTLAVEAEDRLE